MRKLEQIQLNKLISRYGGVGSIIETNTNGSLLILEYDQWECFKEQRFRNATSANDPRLLNYVRKNGYDHIQSLVLIPTPDLSGKVYKAESCDLAKTVSAKFFPEWYYCPNPNCRKLKKLSEWKAGWENKFDKNSFDKNEPSCCYCSTPRGGTQYRRTPLQQVRFVMASLETGDMKDVPFDQLWENGPENGIWTTQRVRGGATNRGELSYHTMPSGDGLNAIYIVREYNGCKSRIYLSEIERNYIINNGGAYKMIVRGSNTLYFPHIVHSLYIPTGENIVCATEEELNISEFRYLTDDENYRNNMIVVEDLIVKRTGLSSKFITRISAIERLKETSVLLSYSRLERGGQKRLWYTVQEGRVGEMVTKIKRPFSVACLNPTWIPVVEDFGEGILFEVDCSALGNVFDDIKAFVHTFCHIVMKELEFQCGYPLTSLNEKIYVDIEKKKAAFMIYTIAGSEGSYGGLVTLTNDEKIVKLIERGTERAKNCPNDPICINEPSYHCFACLDLPETSCIEFNDNLNRRMFLVKYYPVPDVVQPMVNTENYLRDDQDCQSLGNEIGRPKGVVL